MRIKNYGGAHETLLEFDNDMQILFSYSTPVAGFIPGHGYFSVEEHYSKTTTRHVNKYHAGREPSLTLNVVDFADMLGTWGVHA